MSKVQSIEEILDKANVQSIEEILDKVTRELDLASKMIFRIQLEPAEENVRHLLSAMSAISGVQENLYKVEPALKPGYLRIPYPGSGLEAHMHPVMSDSYKMKCEGDIDGARKLLHEYLNNRLDDLTQEQRSFVLKAVSDWQKRFIDSTD